VASLREVALIEARSGDLEQAKSTIGRAQVMWARVPEALRSAVLRTQAEILQLAGDSASGLSLLYQALDLELALQDRFERGAVLVQLAELERAEELPERALSHLEAAVELHERIRSRVTTPELRESFLARRRSHYVELVDVLMELDSQHPGQGYARQAFSVSERSRARTLVELLTEAQVQVRKGIPDHLRRQEETLLTKISLLSGELLEMEQEKSPTMSLRTSLQEALQEATRSYELLEREIRQTWSGYAALRYPATAGLEDIQRLLPRGGTLLQYVLAPERSFVFLVQRGRFEVHVLASAEVIEANVEDVRQLLRRADPRARLRLNQATRVLYDMLISPVESALLDKPRTWVVPDGNLFYLPFEILQDSRGQLVLDRMTVSYVPSATVLSSLGDRAEPSRAQLFVGFAAALDAPDRVGLQELPGAIQEVETIAGLFPDHATVYVGQAANQGSVFNNPVVSNARWLHFASHGLIREDAPLQSAIVLSPDSDGDALLQAAEIFNLRIGSDVVVLSACETGLGSAVRGEGLIGLSRAFFYAGSASVIVSLWKVEDAATASLMQELYRQLRDGDAPTEALRKAKMRVIDEFGYRDPRLWAPFIVVGRGV
jgi:CHAT domain-containing protein